MIRESLQGGVHRVLIGCCVAVALGCSPRAVLPPKAPPRADLQDTQKAALRCAAATLDTAAERYFAANPNSSAPTSADNVGPLAASGANALDWLYTKGNHLYNSDGTLFHGRGVNLPDPRGCGTCACNGTDLTLSTGEVIRRIDVLVDTWHVNFLRLDLESYAATALSAVGDPAYLAAVKQIVAHVQSKNGVYIELAVWLDPSLDANGWPTDATNAILSTLVSVFGDVSQVLFGIANEPQKNYDGTEDAQVWARMNAALAAIRAAELAFGNYQHIVLAQGTGGWARFLTYYETHPLTAAGGNNVAYEVHVYDAASAFGARFIAPSQILPVVIGEFGPIDGVMTLEDTAALMTQAEAANVPYMAWTFHMRCPPNLLVDTSNGGCGIGSMLIPSPWGQQVQAQLTGHTW